MAKKYKRTVTTQTRPDASASDGAQAVERPTAMFARRGAGVNDFNPDYTYVKKDLKRIGILTGAFVVILVALSFILPLIQQ